MVERAVSLPGLEIIQRTFIDILPVAVYADGNHGRQVGKLPVCPVIADIRIIMANHEIIIHRIKNIQQKILQSLRIKVRMVAHHLTNIRKLISLQSRGKKTVCIPAQPFHG